MSKLKQKLEKTIEHTKEQLTFERAWLTDLFSLSRLLKRLWQGLRSLVRLPGRGWRRLADWTRFQWRRSLQPAAGESRAPWLVRDLPLIFIFGLFIFVVINMVGQRSSFNSFTIFTSPPQQRILVVHHTADTGGDLAYQNTRQALDYARLQYDELDLAARRNAWPDLAPYSSLLFVTERLAELDQAQAEGVTRYVADGGGLAVIYPGWNPHLAPLFGVRTEAGQPPLVGTAWGLQFQKDLFPGVKDLFLDREITADYPFYRLSLRPEIEPIAHSGQGRPAVWLNRYRQGRTLFWNTPLLQTKAARGFIVQSVMAVQGLGVLPVANVATIQIDGFPGAFSPEKLEPVASEYDLSVADFYHQVWLPDMRQIARRYNLAYTFLLAFSQADQPPAAFDFADWEQARLDLEGHDLFYSRYAAQQVIQEGELGFCGYNQVPLTTEAWPSPDRMQESLRAAATRWEADTLDPWPVTYAPPDSRYDQTGLQALVESWPSVRVISGHYIEGHFEEGGNREFGPEPWQPALFALPQATTGYTLTPKQRLAMLSELGTMGVWTHALHPAELFDTPQNNPEATEYGNPHSWGWREDEIGGQNGFYYRFRRWLNVAQTYYPWLRYVETGQAYPILQTYLNNQITVELKPYRLSLQSTAPTFFQVRVNDGRRINLNRLQGAQFVHLYEGEGYQIYTLRSLGEEVRLELLIPDVDEALLADRQPVP